MWGCCQPSFPQHIPVWAAPTQCSGTCCIPSAGLSTGPLYSMDGRAWADTCLPSENSPAEGSLPLSLPPGDCCPFTPQHISSCSLQTHSSSKMTAEKGLL